MAQTKWFVLVERGLTPSTLVGPYSDEDAAIVAMEDSPHIDDLIDEDSLGVYVFELPYVDSIGYTPPEGDDE